MDKRLLITLAIFLGILATSGAIFFYARGFKINPQNGRIEKTGMILAKSTPDGAKVFVDGKLVTATNSPISLKPGTYRITIIKDGYSTWEKELPVKEELVTNINALLIPKTPELKPLTASGAFLPKLSEDKDKIAYLVKSGEKPGLWLFPLSSSPLTFFRNNPRPLALDTKEASASAATEVAWAPDDSQVLATLGSRFYLLETNKLNSPPLKKILEPESTQLAWEEEKTQKKALLAQRFGLENDWGKIATDSATLWSPDERHFLYTRKKEEKIQWRVRNLEKPLGVGEKEDYLVLETAADSNLQLLWHSDSAHLILTEGMVINLIEIDGKNKTQVYAGTLFDSFVAPTPSGDRLIILTSFKEEGEPNLYTLSLQ